MATTKDVEERLHSSYDVRLLRKIAEGGMGSVYEGVLSGADGFEKTVAIKTILETYSENPRFVEMFIAEAKLVGDLVHQNICQVYHLGKAGRRYYIAMEYIGGVNLKEFIDRHLQLGWKVPPALAAFIVSRVCRGLEYAHRKRDKQGRLLQVVHRDVSPKNIMISTDGEVKLTDFGVAKAHNLLNLEGKVRVGNLPYMSPEQARYEPTDPRSDLFSLGAVAFELFTGQRLFRSRSPRKTVALVLEKLIPPLRELAPEVPEATERIIGKALQRDLDGRYQDAGEMGYDLEYEIYHRGYGPTIISLEKHMRKLFPGLFRAGTERHLAVPLVDDRNLSICSTMATNGLTMPGAEESTLAAGVIRPDALTDRRRR